MNRAWLVLVLSSALACERGELLGTAAGNGAGGAAPDGPLSEPEARDTDPTFTGDRTELYLMSDRTSSKDIFVSKRADPTSEWGAPVAVPELSTGYQEENPRISADGLRLWFYSDRDRPNGTIWEMTRASRSDPWGPIVPVQGLSIGEGASNVSAGTNEDATLAVLSARDGSGYDLYLFERATAADPFGEPAPLGELNSASDDFDPYLSPNALAVAFASNRRGTFDIFLARRTSIDVPFEAPVPLELSTPDYQESAPNLSPDLAFIMYSSDRGGSHDIYEVQLFP